MLQYISDTRCHNLNFVCLRLCRTISLFAAVLYKCLRQCRRKTYVTFCVTMNLKKMLYVFGQMLLCFKMFSKFGDSWLQSDWSLGIAGGTRQCHH